MEETQGVVRSAETGSPSRGTLASLREASTCTTCVIPPHQVRSEVCGSYVLGKHVAISNVHCECGGWNKLWSDGYHNLFQDCVMTVVVSPEVSCHGAVVQLACWVLPFVPEVEVGIVW